ncbi:MAG: radical SAM protein [Bdellovibrionota bacterium]
MRAFAPWPITSKQLINVIDIGKVYNLALLYGYKESWDFRPALCIISSMQSLRSRLNFAYDIIASKVTGNYRPLQMQISLTNSCNLKCSYCYAMYPEREHKDLNTEDLKKIITEMAAAGTRRVNLVGGEPLLRKDIGEIIQLVKSLGMQCAMTTNGYLVKKKIEEIKGIDLVCLSIDGNKEATDANRAVGCYDRVIEAMGVLKEHGVTFQVSAVLTKNSIPSFKFLLDMGKEKGFSVGFTTMIEQTIDGKKVAPPNLPSDEEYREILQKIIDWKNEGYPVLFSERVIAYARDWQRSFSQDKIIGEEPDFDHIRCNAGKFFGIVDVNGEVFPCPATVDVMKVKNAKEVGFAAAFKAINNHNCRTCHIPCQNEFSRMYDFDVSVIKNILKNYRSAT